MPSSICGISGRSKDIGLTGLLPDAADVAWGYFRCVIGDVQLLIQISRLCEGIPGVS
jgi:hypothetical protein